MAVIYALAMLASTSDPPVAKGVEASPKGPSGCPSVEMRRHGRCRGSTPLTYGFEVGNKLPHEFEGEEVPDERRHVFADQPDVFYRVRNGKVLEIDRRTRLVMDLVELGADAAHEESQ